jgi:hypothetical protein
MSRMCVRIFIAAVLSAATISTASAGSWANCKSGPPAWWNAPRVSHTTTQSWGEGYGRRGPTHEYSAQRRASASYTPQRFRDPSRW